MGKTFQRKDRNDKDWYISFYEPTGRRVKRRIGPSKKVAEAALCKVEVAIAEGKYLELKKQNKTKFEDFLEEYYRLHCAGLKSCRKTHDTYRKQFKEIFKGKFLNEITVYDIEQYKTQRRQEVAVATVNRSMSFLRCLFNKAIDWGRYEGFNPVSKVKFFKENNARLRYLEKEEIARLLSFCDGNLKAIVSLALNTGMRRGEIFDMKWEYVDFRVRVIYLLDTKSGETREIPMNDEVVKILSGIKKHSNSPYVFWTKNGKRIDDIRKSFWTALGKSGIKEFHFHDLRHTFASQLVMSGVDLNTVRELGIRVWR